MSRISAVGAYSRPPLRMTTLDEAPVPPVTGSARAEQLSDQLHSRLDRQLSEIRGSLAQAYADASRPAANPPGTGQRVDIMA